MMAPTLFVGLAGWPKPVHLHEAALVKSDRLMRAIQGEGGDGNIEPVTRFGFHLIGSEHDARRRLQWRAAGIFEGRTRV